MNEQLIVKNFGPIKDATVDFKRVTVFIGPTGGGKSTLAKLAAIWRNKKVYFGGEFPELLSRYSLEKYWQTESSLWFAANSYTSTIDKDLNLSFTKKEGAKMSASDDAAARRDLKLISEKLMETVENLPTYNTTNLPDNIEEILDSNRYSILKAITEARELLTNNHIHHFISSIATYITSERSFIPSIEYSWAGLLRDDIGLPKDILEFANEFSLSRRNIPELYIPFLNIKYIHRNGQDFIKIPESETLFRLYETASGIQSVTPLLVLLEHLSRNIEQAQSFIIEEPELNLYPTAQQGLLNWLVEKCTQGENDLTITTHSPYILSHLNLLLYAYQVAEKHPERAEEVAEVVPRASWINPQEFACYQVENGGVTSLVSDELGLIDDNGLDNLSGDAADAFDNLIRLSKGVARK
jgi:AAA15 family ATPase/GTPase